VLTRYTRTLPGPAYMTTVVVLLQEVFKLVFCLMMVVNDVQGPAVGLATLHREVWLGRRETSKLALPALCYTIQNNLVFVAVSNLSAAAAQVLYQTKTITTALFSVLILGKVFRKLQWLSFVVLSVGVVLVQNQDAKSATMPAGSSPVLGVAAALSAAALSGFAGVFLELMFTSGAVSLWLRNVQLGMFAIPLQLLAILQHDRVAMREHGVFYGFHPSTWMLVFVQAAGGMLAAVVIKYAGNILKTFATVLAILCTCLVSIPLFAFQPTLLFWVGVAVVITAVWMYSR